MNLNHEKMKVGKVVDETVDIEDIDIAIKRIEGSNVAYLRIYLTQS